MAHVYIYDGKPQSVAGSFHDAQRNRRLSKDKQASKQASKELATYCAPTYDGILTFSSDLKNDFHSLYTML